MKIGVFDSGIGGEAVAEELRGLFPDARILSVNDHIHVPYGGRTKEEIISLTSRAIQPLIDWQCDAIVIACNTATTNAIATLRHDFPAQKFIGLEPMVKPAARITKTKTIAVLATPATLTSERYAELKRQWASALHIIQPDCHDWASLIEAGRETEINVELVVSTLVENNVDVIVLACTHYHWLRARIQSAAGPLVTILEPTNAIKDRIIDITGSTNVRDF